jgi:hypothetical protein
VRASFVSGRATLQCKSSPNRANNLHKILHDEKNTDNV